MPFRLKASHTGETGHCEEVEEYLGRVKDDGRFGDDHLGRSKSVEA